MARLGKLQGEATAELEDQQTQILNAGSAVKRSLEEKKLKEQEKLQAAKAAKDKTKKKGKGKEEVEASAE